MKTVRLPSFFIYAPDGKTVIGDSFVGIYNPKAYGKTKASKRKTS